jgi:hypothetical protein
MLQEHVRLRDGLFSLGQPLEPGQEPLVDSRHFINLVDRITLFECSSNSKQSVIGRVGNFIVDIIDIVVLTETRELIINTPDGFLNSLFEGSSNSHNFTYTLHTRTEVCRDSAKLFQIPSRDLDDTVIERRFETGRSELGDRVFDLVEWDIETELGSDKCQRVSGSFGSQSG